MHGSKTLIIASRVSVFPGDSTVTRIEYFKGGSYYKQYETRW